MNAADYLRGRGVEEARAHIGEVINVRASVDDRPYRIFGLEPVIFACSALFLLGRGAFVAPVQAVLVAVFMLIGIVLYYCIWSPLVLYRANFSVKSAFDLHNVGQNPSLCSRRSSIVKDLGFGT
jgi:hypothetical protein